MMENVLYESLPVAHKVLHEDRGVQARGKRFAGLEETRELRATPAGGKLCLNALSGRGDGSRALAAAKVVERLVDNLKILMEVQHGLDGRRGGDRAERKMRILQTEPRGQGARVAASEGDDRGVGSVVRLLDVLDERGGVSEGLLGRKPFQIFRRQLLEGLRLSIVAMFNADLKRLVFGSVHGHSAASDHRSRGGRFATERQKDWCAVSRPQVALNEVALRPRAVVLQVEMIQALREGEVQLLGSTGRFLIEG